jgi:DNA-binding transcriptional LysR family regulator
LIAQKGSLRQAASQLNLTPAAASIRLKQLEANAQVKLFDHGPNKLTLTEDGRVFLEQVQRILEDLDNSLSLLHEKKGVCAGSISVALGTDMTFFLAPAIAAFVKDNPLVRLSLLARPSPDVLGLVMRNQANIGIGRYGSLPKTVKKIPLLRSGLVAIYPGDHPASLRRRLSLPDLASYELILLTSQSATRHAVNQVFFNSGLEIKTVIEAGTCFAIKEYVSLGLGVGLVHDTCMAGRNEPRLKMSDVSHLFGKSEILLIHREKKNFSLPHTRFVEAITRMKNKFGPNKN